MTTLYVAAYKGYSSVSKIIRWVTRSEYSHVSLYDPVEQKNYEAWHDPNGVFCNPSIATNHSNGTIVDLFSLSVDINEYHTIITFLKAQVGKKYDFSNVMKFLPIPRMILPKTRTDTSKWFCSELVVAASQVAGCDILTRCNPAIIAPADVVRSPILVYAGKVVVGNNSLVAVDKQGVSFLMSAST